MPVLQATYGVKQEAVLQVKHDRFASKTRTKDLKCFKNIIWQIVVSHIACVGYSLSACI